jgi:hypothetical protein
VEMFEADAGHAGDLFLGECFLTRLDGDHFNLPSVRSARPLGHLWLRGRSGFVKIPAGSKYPPAGSRGARTRTAAMIQTNQITLQ